MFNEAIRAISDSLSVHTRELFPHQWAVGKDTLARCYRERIRWLEAALAAESPAISRALGEARVEIHHAFFDIASGHVEWNY